MIRAVVRTKQALVALGLGAAVALTPAAAPGQTVIEEWAQVKAPAPPALKPVKIEPKTSALLVLDIIKQGCSTERRPRCVSSLPKIEKLLSDARQHAMAVVYSTYPPNKLEDVLKEVAPKGGESFVTARSDKFIGTDLDKTLKDKGITTVVVVGTAAHGAVLYTASSAAMRGYDVVVPVDAMSAENLYAEQAAAWLLANAPTISNKVTLTKAEMISY